MWSTEALHDDMLVRISQSFLEGLHEPSRSVLIEPHREAFDLPGSLMQLPAACRPLNQSPLTLEFEAGFLTMLNHAYTSRDLCMCIQHFTCMMLVIDQRFFGESC